MARFEAEMVTLRYAEAAADDQDEAEATALLECGRGVLRFYEAAMAHVPAHPRLSLHRYELSQTEAELGDVSAAVQMMEQSVWALGISHGPSHPLCREAAAWLSDLKESAVSS